MLQSKSYIAIIVIGLILTLLLSFIYLNRSAQPQALTVLSVDPAPNSQIVPLHHNINVQLNENPKYFNLLKITINPFIATTVKIVGQSVIFEHKEPFDEQTIYTASLTQNSIDEPLVTWSFSTVKNPYDSKWYQTREEINNKYYPLLQYMPIKNEDYTILYADRLQLKVLIFNTNTGSVKQKVLDFIESKGIDPDAHQINYIDMMK